jgi:hypothetical protein
MKKITTATGKFGPYNSVEILSDRYHVDGADLPFTVIGQGEITDVVDGDFPPPVITISDEQTAEQAKAVREERNAKLSKSDWTQVLDAPVNQAAWATYRQALRDLTGQEGFPWTITWPVQP